MNRPIALTSAIAASLLAVSGAGGGQTQQTPKRGGTVVVAFTLGEPACLNRLLGERCGGGASVSAVVEKVIEGAFRSGPRHFAPDLVTSVKYTRTPPFTLTYHIRPAARWSDGFRVISRDFVFTDKAFQKYLPADEPHRRYVRSVSALDPKTVRVVLRSPYAAWRELFPVVLPQHALAGMDLERVWRDSIDDPKTGASIGSGPFLVDHWERGKELTLVRNRRYWGAHTAYPNRVVLRFGLDDPAEALRDGEVDVVQRRPDPGTEPDFQALPGMKQLYGPGIAWEHFDIRRGTGGHPALKNKIVRRALAYGIDRDAIVRAVYGRFLPKWRPSESAVLLDASHGYQPNWSTYRYRPALARRLLEQAGCTRGTDGIYVCGRERLSLRFVTTPGSTRRSIAVELAQRQLRQVGVDVIPIYAPFASFGELLGQGNFDVALYTWFYDPDVGAGSDIYGCGGTQNFTGYCQRLVTRDLNNADRALDPAQHARLLNRADKQMAKDVPVIPLWNEPAAATVRSTVHGVVPNFPSLMWNAENWWLDR